MILVPPRACQWAWRLVMLILFLLMRTESNLFHRHSVQLEEALHFINGVQQPDNCTGGEYLLMEIGIHGGFAAQFQLAAAEWMRLFAAGQFRTPVLIRGRIIGYTDGAHCAHVANDWTCYFHPTSACQEELLRTGRALRSFQLRPAAFDAETVPPQFQQLGLAFWWGAVQTKLFHMQPEVQQYIAARARVMNAGRGFPFGLSAAGLHVRHGDKRNDGFEAHSLRELLKRVRHSPDCPLHNPRGDCFKTLDLTAHATTVTLMRAQKHHVPVLRSGDVGAFDRLTDNANISADVRSLMHLNSRTHLHAPGIHPSPFIRQLDVEKRIGSSDNSSSSSDVAVVDSSDGVYVLPLHVFVASDDGAVLQVAQERGFLTALEGQRLGVSQQTDAHDGMLKTLLTHPEMANSATLEIISDIYFLSQCSTLIGTAASQVFRMAVAMSNATGTLQFAAVIDSAQIGMVYRMSAQFGVPFPEQFHLF